VKRNEILNRNKDITAKLKDTDKKSVGICAFKTSICVKGIDLNELK
jgi:hypothetical protein